jgi:hypothetical protein
MGGCQLPSIDDLVGCQETFPSPAMGAAEIGSAVAYVGEAP